MKELTLDQEAGIYQSIYKMSIPDYIPSFYFKQKKYENSEYEKYLHRDDGNGQDNSLSEAKSNELTEEEDNVLSRYLICDICGKSGHIPKDCKKIPTIYDIESEIQDDIDFAERKILNDSKKKKKEMNDQNEMVDADVIHSKIYSEDHFGLYVVDGGENDPIKIDGSLDDDLYCINCGKKGHIFSNCTKPSLSKILENVNFTGSNVSPTTAKNRFEYFWNHFNT